MNAKTPARNYLYEPANCPSQHSNDGNDVCEDCGHYLNAAMTEETDPDKLARAKRLGYTVRQSIDTGDQARVYAFTRPNGDEDSEWFPLEEMAWDAAAGDSGLWALDHGDPAAAPAPAPETRRVVVLSTAHMTAQTLAMLNETRLKDWPVAGGVLPYGFYIYVHDEGENEHPEDLEACFSWARGRFDYIQFDSDAEPRADIPTHEH